MAKFSITFMGQKHEIDELTARKIQKVPRSQQQEFIKSLPVVQKTLKQTSARQVSLAA